MPGMADSIRVDAAVTPYGSFVRIILVRYINNSHVNNIQTMILKALVTLLLLASAMALFAADSTVFKLTAGNFKSSVLDSDQFWLVEFYAPWCGHCKKSAPEFQKAAEILDGVVRVGAVDMDTDRKAGEPYNVQGYPTIKFFGKDKSSPIAYESGERTFDKFVDYCLEKLKSEVSDRLDAENSETEL